MKRLIPIIRDDVYGLFDRDLTGKIVLVTMDAPHVSRMLLELLEVFVKSEHKKGIILSYDRPASCIKAVLGKFWISVDDIVFLDGATRIGGLPRERDGEGPRGAKVRFLEEPFDIKCLMGTLRDVLFKEFKEKAQSPGADGKGPIEADGEGSDRKALEKELIETELEFYGIQGSESSIMKYRIMQRVKERVRRMEMGLDHDDRGDRPRKGIPAGTTLSVKEWLASWREGADFIVVENLATMSAYFSDEDLDEILRCFKTLIAEGLCKSVVIFLDRRQYQRVMDPLRETPDVEFGLESNIYMGVTGYRFVPSDNGPD